MTSGVRTRAWAPEPDDGIARAWERFVAGDDHVTGVSADIVSSWYRCREHYRVDPGLREAPVAPTRTQQSSPYEVVFAELGGSAVSVLQEVEGADTIVTVADGSGRILAAWGDRATLSRAKDNNLAPLSYWAEGASGTNGIGTALEADGPVLIRGAEHWCQGFHNWVCAGIAIRDVVTEEPAAVLNISRWRAGLPAAATSWLAEAVTSAKWALRMSAWTAGTELVAAFAQARSRVGLAVLDTGGNVVLADDEAGLYLGVPGCSPAIDPGARWDAGLEDLARSASRHSRGDPSWVGHTTIASTLTAEPIPVTVRPVFSPSGMVGSLVSLGVDEGEQLTGTRAERIDAHPRRIIGTRGDRLVLLRPGEVCFAEADGNDVWLSTDRGRLQASSQSLDKLEGEFADSGFLRVHRRFLVNLNRVREVERGFKGELLLILDVRGNDPIPVSRRNVAVVRRALGL